VQEKELAERHRQEAHVLRRTHALLDAHQAAAVASWLHVPGALL
jgi:hypothetical protein